MTEEMQGQLAAMAHKLNEMMEKVGVPGSNGGGGNGLPSWLTPPAAFGATPNPIGWSIALEVDVNGPQGPGKATIDLAFPASTWPQAQQIVQGLIQQGYPVKVFTPRFNGGGFGGGGFGGGGFGGGGFNRGGGWGGNGGGWNRGGGWGRG